MLKLNVTKASVSRFSGRNIAENRCLKPSCQRSKRALWNIDMMISYSKRKLSSLRSTQRENVTIVYLYELLSLIWCSFHEISLQKIEYFLTFELSDQTMSVFPYLYLTFLHFLNMFKDHVTFVLSCCVFELEIVETNYSNKPLYHWLSVVVWTDFSWDIYLFTETSHSSRGVWPAACGGQGSAYGHVAVCLVRLRATKRPEDTDFLPADLPLCRGRRSGEGGQLWCVLWGDGGGLPDLWPLPGHREENKHMLFFNGL